MTNPIFKSTLPSLPTGCFNSGNTICVPAEIAQGISYALVFLEFNFQKNSRPFFAQLTVNDFNHYECDGVTKLLDATMTVRTYDIEELKQSLTPQAFEAANEVIENAFKILAEWWDTYYGPDEVDSYDPDAWYDKNIGN